MSNDHDPVFIAEFYKNLKILSQDLFRKTVHDEILVASPLSPKPERRASVRRSSFRFAGGPSDGGGADDADYYTSASLMERVRQYAAEGGIPMEFVERYASQVKNREASK